jgi:catechol 2,3-dioxygenase-like lactoylglutathione lyase family enzyme
MVPDLLSPLRRLTVFVGDIERSLAFYRDLLGLEIFYDAEIDDPVSGRLLGVPGARSRVVSLQGGQEPFGMVGLAALLEPPVAPRRRFLEQVEGPDSLLLFAHERLDVLGLCDELSGRGADIVCPPVTYEVPVAGRLDGFSLRDPDGLVVALMRIGGNVDGLTQVLGELRRGVIVVDDLEASLGFYRDVLGLSVFYDQVIESEEEGRLLGLPGATVRVVSLQSSGRTFGMVGLLEVQKPPLAARRAVRNALGAPDVALVFVTSDITCVADRLRASGHQIVAGPLEYEIPGRGTCAGLSARDPNGILLDITQLG